ncbi:MAG: thiamine biosynthesis protein ThiS, partial [Caldiserica bacterium]
MKVKFQGRITEIDKKSLTVKELLKILNLSSTTVIVLKDGEIVTEDEILKEENEIEIISAISGGT